MVLNNRIQKTRKVIRSIRIAFVMMLLALILLDIYFIARTVLRSLVFIGIISLVIVFILLVMMVGYDSLREQQANIAENLIESKHLLIRYISHEIRSPLNAVHLGLNVLVQEMKAPKKGGPEVNSNFERQLSEWIRLIDEVEDGTNRVVHVLDDLIHSDKLVSGSLKLEQHLVDIRKLISTCTALYVDEAQAKGVFLAHDSVESQAEASYHGNEETGKLYLLGDQDKLEQVLNILIHRGINYTPSGETVSIRVNWSPERVWRTAYMQDMQQRNLEDKGSFLVNITDSGPSITAKQLDELFSAIQGIEFDTSLLKPVEGGEEDLELWICKGIVELHNGKFTAKSNNELRNGMGNGTTFTLHLPAMKETGNYPHSKAPCKPTAQRDDREEALYLDLNHQVLVVEDSLSARKVVCRLLTNVGCICQQASNGQECLDIVEENIRRGKPLDFILLDFEMPVMNGPDTARILRENKILIPIIGVTGNILPEDRQLFLDCGADAVLRKPLSLSLLKKTLAEVIMRKKEISYII